VAVDVTRWHPTAADSSDFAYRSGSAPVSFSRHSLALCSAAKSAIDLAPLPPRCSAGRDALTLHLPASSLPAHFHPTLILPSASSTGRPSWTCWPGAPARARTTAPSAPTSARRPRSSRPPGSPWTRGWGGCYTGILWQVGSAVTRSWSAHCSLDRPPGMLFLGRPLYQGACSTGC
jgi:hypothetical protein